MTITISDNYPITTPRAHIEADLKRQATEIPGTPGRIDIEVVQIEGQRLTDAIPRVEHRYLRASLDIEQDEHEGAA